MVLYVACQSNIPFTQSRRYTRRKSSVPWYMALIGRSPSQLEEHTREKPRSMRKSMMLGSQMISIEGGSQPGQLPFLNETREL